jgi:hypothetical protein
LLKIGAFSSQVLALGDSENATKHDLAKCILARTDAGKRRDIGRAHKGIGGAF